MPTRLLIVDDHDLVRQGLRMLFGLDAQIEVVGEARNGKEGLRLAHELKPDVVLMDLHMPIMDGIAATAVLRCELPEIEVVVMTAGVGFSAVSKAIRAGAIGYAFKDTRPNELRDLVLAAAAGKVGLTPRQIAPLIDAVQVSETSPEVLDKAEREMLVLLAQGRSDQQIADTLHLDAPEVKTQLGQTLQKLKLPGRMSAVLYAMHQGLVSQRIPELT